MGLRTEKWRLAPLDHAGSHAHTGIPRVMNFPRRDSIIPVAPRRSSPHVHHLVLVCPSFVLVCPSPRLFSFWVLTPVPLDHPKRAALRDVGICYICAHALISSTTTGASTHWLLKMQFPVFMKCRHGAAALRGRSDVGSCRIPSEARCTCGTLDVAAPAASLPPELPPAAGAWDGAAAVLSLGG